MTWTDKGIEREKELREMAGRLGMLWGEGEYEWCENEGAVRVEGGKERPVGSPLGGDDWIWDGQELWMKVKREECEAGSKSESELGGPAARALEGWLERGRVAEMLEEVWEVLKEHYPEGWRMEMNWDGADPDEDRDSDEFQRGELEIRLMTTNRSKMVVGRGEEWVKAGEAIRFVVNGFLGEVEGE